MNSWINEHYCYFYEWLVIFWFVFQGCNTYISSIARDGEQIGIVTFNTNAETEVGLTMVNDQGRPVLVGYLPTKTGGRTSIGSGIEYIA